MGIHAEVEEYRSYWYYNNLLTRASRNSSHHLFLLSTATKLIAFIWVILTVGGRPKLYDIQAAVSAGTAFSHSVLNSPLQLNFTLPQ